MSSHIYYIGCAVTAQLLWGCYSTIGRYLQTRVEGKPSFMVVLSLALSIGLLAMFVDLGVRLYQEKTLRSEKDVRRGLLRQESHKFSAIPTDDPISQPSDTIPSESYSSQPEPHHRSQSQSELLSPWPPSSDAIKSILLYSFFTLGRMGTNMWASGLTYAYINSLVMLLQPFTVAVLEKYLFNQAFPRGLYPLLTFSLLGSICVIYAQTEEALNSSSDDETVSNAYLRARDYAGIVLQFISILFSTAARLEARRSKRMVTRHELIIAQFAFTAIILGLVAVIFDTHSWYAILHMDYIGWLMISFLGMFTWIFLKTSLYSI
jgi:drug/metabolite transporter (DMT)-like permease